MELIAKGGKPRGESARLHTPPTRPNSSRSRASGRSGWTCSPTLGADCSPDRPSRSIVKGLGGRSGGPTRTRGKLSKAPGMKVLHVQDLDFRSTVPTLKAALREVRSWSESNPRHVPILILLELKDDAIAGLPTRPVPIDAEGLKEPGSNPRSWRSSRLDKLLVPDDAGASPPRSPEAIRGRGWPRVDDVRGKVMFALDNEGRLRDLYLDGHEAAQEAVSCSRRHGGRASVRGLVQGQRSRSTISSGFRIWSGARLPRPHPHSRRRYGRGAGKGRRPRGETKPWRAAPSSSAPIIRRRVPSSRAIESVSRAASPHESTRSILPRRQVRPMWKGRFAREFGEDFRSQSRQ